MKKKSTIPFVDIESIPVLIKDFLTQKIPQFSDKIFTPENMLSQFEEKSRSFTAEKRDILFEVLSAQQGNSVLSEKQQENLAALKNENTFTVTTGHQLNLFTGPVFFIFKILQTIKLADFLNGQYRDKKVVPIFWMASEDHDFEEINHFKTRTDYYEMHGKSGGAVGNIVVEDNSFIAEFEANFKDSVFGTELLLLMKKAYRKGNTLSEATRILVQELFSDYGLLILDGDSSLLKKEMQQIFKNELLENALFTETKDTVTFLTEEYGKVQVNPREINLFYLTDTRNRIEFADGKYKAVDTDKRFSKAEILNELEKHPERFSPNAVMRPVYQETVLPNLAYIGGNAEIMYWLELRNYFTALQLPFPILIPRNSLLFLTEKTFGKIQKLELEPSDFFKNFAAVTKDLLLENNEILQQLTINEENLEAHFEELASAAEKTDETFGNLVRAEKTRQLKSFARMKKRLLRAEKIKQKEKLERLENLFLTVHPGKNWQERSFNFSVFYADHGREWLQNCYEGINVQKPELGIFTI